MTRQFVALARVSSREQEREGFSLEVQEEALIRYVAQQGGSIIKLFRIAETATKPEERGTFKELLSYAKKNAAKISGLLFFKVDRAARNLFDYVELERLEADYGIEVVYVSQPTENTPAGRMMRRTLANMASFYTEQQSLDVRDGLHRRVQAGLFVGKAPYGYRNVRVDGKSLVELHPENAPKVKQLFELYAHHLHTLDSLIDKMEEHGLHYSEKRKRFPRSKVHSMLRDRAYIGDVSYHGQWYPGTQQPIVDRATFDRVQVLIGEVRYLAHELVYGAELMTCGHCGSPITAEAKTKQTKSGEKRYVYYRCTKYTRKGHPRIRVREEELERQTLEMFDKLRIDDDDVRHWFSRIITARTQESQKASKVELAEIQRQISSIQQQRDELLNLRIQKEIDEETFASKNTELRDRSETLKLKMDARDRSQWEMGDVAVKAFELSQTLKGKWFRADVRAKRQLLDIVCLNLVLNDVTLDATMRKPFDVLAKGPVLHKSRADWI